MVLGPSDPQLLSPSSCPPAPDPLQPHGGSDMGGHMGETGGWEPPIQTE